MGFPYALHETKTLLGVMQEQPEVPNYWLSLCFPRAMTFDTEYVDFEKIAKETRRIAPFVMPMAQGRPVYEKRSTPTQFKPAYVKQLDTYQPQRAMIRAPGHLLTPTAPSPQANYGAWVVDCAGQHRRAIERRWEWMAAQAILNGSVTITGEEYPTQVLNFGRAAGHTVTLGAGARWGDAGVSILDNLQTWMDLMHRAEFGGSPNRITLGLSAWAAFRKNQEVKDQLMTEVRGTQANITTGLLQTGDIKYAGTLVSGLEVYVYNDYFQNADGTVVPLMDPRDIVLTGPAVTGIQAFGAIQDANAQFQPLPIYSRLYMENNPAVPTMLSQSAPLMVPVNPNATFRARVLA